MSIKSLIQIVIIIIIFIILGSVYYKYFSNDKMIIKEISELSSNNAQSTENEQSEPNDLLNNESSNVEAKNSTTDTNNINLDDVKKTDTSANETNLEYENDQKIWSEIEQDSFAAASQRKTAEAIKENKFVNEIVPVKVKVRKEEVEFKQDEYPKSDSTVEKLAKLRPAFKKDGTVTAGNASGVNDGAASLCLMTGEMAKKKDVEPLAKIVSWAQCGVDPSIMGTGPIPASKLALKKAGWGEDELDLIEANEAFAAQAMAVNKEMGWTLDKVNVNGGSIALGHPVGASGARVLVTLIHEMKKRNSHKGLVTLCIGGGMGIAMCIERNFLHHK